MNQGEDDEHQRPGGALAFFSGVAAQGDADDEPLRPAGQVVQLDDGDGACTSSYTRRSSLHVAQRVVRDVDAFHADQGVTKPMALT
jgi:hypothetical protein